MATDGRGPGDRPALSRCVPVGRAEFAADHWGRLPLFTRAADLGEDFSDLFSLDAVDELVSSRALRTPFVRMAKEGTVLPPARFTGPGGFGAEVADQLDAAKVLAEFADGATLVLQGLHRTWPPIAEFSRRLAEELGHPAQVNAYITPASSRGFDPHYDVHDVFVLQIAGEKHWRIHEPVHVDPLRDQPWSDHRAEVAARAQERPTIDETFRPGDALYLPRGWIHSAEALGGVSVHLTIGVAAYTRHDVVQEAVARAADTAELRASLPLGFDPADPAAVAPVVEQTVEALISALADPSARDAVAAAVSDRLRRRRRSDSPAAPVRPLATIAAADRMGPDSVVVVRPGLGADVTVEVETVTVRLPTKKVALPIAAREAVEALLSGRPVAVGALPLDERSAVVVARRLLREGIVVPVDGGTGAGAGEFDPTDEAGVSSDGERSATADFGTASAT
ncbi:cupin domain-containing protein [Leifsonia virtsii]|uniref:Cupin domain-containing protein n=1 Tax=Leifsonia virtsii TaxID=3035915 RepID=A0ABT8ITI4_9MICO|nr:cupin domain-containing protein [Leifsonia virtsii]MDN4595771.1 cupin domain-containing protein [Leifsonia virtsii]